MSPWLRNSVVLSLMALGAIAVGGARAQSPEAPSGARLVAFTMEPGAPEFAEVFELRLTVRVAPGIVAFLPDTLLPARASVSAGLGSWTESAGPADSVDLRATYPVMAFLNGGVELPSLELWTRSALAGEAGGARATSDLRDGGSGGDGLQRVLMPVGGTQIKPLQEMAEAASGGLLPRPAADVLGGQWSIWLLSAIGVVAIAAAFLAWLLVTRWRAARAGAEATGTRSPRDEALHELDRIRGLGWHTDGRIVDFYDATTGVLRRFSGEEVPDWSIALTSSELVARFRDRWGPGSVEALGSVVWAAERVKFGALRPPGEAAEGHWKTIRHWIEGRPED